MAPKQTYCSCIPTIPDTPSITSASATRLLRFHLIPVSAAKTCWRKSTISNLTESLSTTKLRDGSSDETNLTVTNEAKCGCNQIAK